MNIELFNETCERIIHSAIDRDGVIGGSSQIGTLGEKTVHAVIKNYVEPDTSNHEIKIESFYADIINDDGIVEIQTGNFDRLRRKLKVLLDLNPFTIVYPICHKKMIHWINYETGEVSKPRKSTKTGNASDIFRELYKIKKYLNHPNLKFHIILMDMDEYRLLDDLCLPRPPSTRPRHEDRQEAGEEKVMHTPTMTVSSSPHLHEKNSTASIMYQVSIALVPALLWGIYVFGFKALLVTIVSIATALLVEYLLGRFSGESTLSDGSALLTGLLVALNMSPSVPLFIPVIASA